MENEKLNFTLSGEDLEILEQIREILEKDQGKVASISVIRIALRKMLKEVQA